MTNHNRLAAAMQYAAADKSDPFAKARVLTHMRTGLCGFTDDGRDAFYSAEETVETRTMADGTEYKAKIYRNRIRP